MLVAYECMQWAIERYVIKQEGVGVGEEGTSKDMRLTFACYRNDYLNSKPGREEFGE